MWGDNDPAMQLSDDEFYQARHPLNSDNLSISNSGNPKQHNNWMLLPAAASIASFGGIIFGYDIGIISGALLQLRTEFSTTCYDQEMMVTTLIIGALVASLCGGYLLDKFGRKLMIIINAFVCVIGAVVLAASHSFALFIVGRFVIGCSVALSAIADCVYISEIAPPKWRGLFVSMNEMGITIGILLSYFINYLLVSVPSGWRYMFLISAIPAIIQIFGMLFLPSSPRWLVNKGKDNEAIEVIKILWPYLNPVDELDRLKNSISTEMDYNIFHLFTTRENLRTRMFIGFGIVFFQQFSGQPTVLYYAPILLQALGYDSDISATLATIGLGVVKVFFTLITLCTVDKLGRKTFLLLGATVMTISLVILSGLTVSFRDISPKPNCDILKPELPWNHTTNSSTMLRDNYGHNIDFINGSFPSNFSIINNDIQKINAGIPKSIKYTSLCALMLFVIGYSVGYGPMSWLLLSEIFPTGIKGRAFGVVSSVNWATNILLSATFLDMLDATGPFWIFLIYGVIGMLSILFLAKFVPETKGKSLELLSVELSQSVHLPCSFISGCNIDNILVEEEWQLLINNNMDGDADVHGETTESL